MTNMTSPSLFPNVSHINSNGNTPTTISAAITTTSKDSGGSNSEMFSKGVKPSDIRRFMAASIK